MKLEELTSMSKPNGGRRMRGQSEVIGGVIVLTALIIAMGLVFTNLGKLSSSSITGISMRAAFETEKSFEKIQATRTSGQCSVKNTGNTPVTIIRAWSNSQPINLSKITLNPGESQSIPLVDFIVTSRGNVFPCTTQQQTININATGPFTSEQVLNSTRIKNGLENQYVYANISSSTYAVVYNYTNKWYCSSLVDKAIPLNVTPSIADSDADDNSVNELVVVNANKCSSVNSGTGPWGDNNDNNFKNATVKLVLKLVLKNVIDVTTNETDTLTIYFKLIVTTEKGGESQQLSVYPVITLNGTIVISSPATTTAVGARQDLVNIFGSTVIPVKAFGLNLTTGTYDLILEFTMSGQSIKINSIRLEYIAVVGNGVVFSTPWTK
ncbi:MAG: hypothetical protein QXE10_04110 [Desulfurococcaceae archaeon]